MVELNVATFLLVIVALKLICFLATAAPNTGKVADESVPKKPHAPLFSFGFCKRKFENEGDELKAILGIRPKWCYLSKRGEDDVTACKNVCPMGGVCKQTWLSNADGKCNCDVPGYKQQSLNEAWKRWIWNLKELPPIMDPCISGEGGNADEECNRICPDTAAGKCQEYTTGLLRIKKRGCFCGKRNRNIVDRIVEQLPLATALAAWKDPCGPEKGYNLKHLRNSECNDACPEYTKGQCRNDNGHCDTNNDHKNNVCYCQVKDKTYIRLKAAKLSIDKPRFH